MKQRDSRADPSPHEPDVIEVGVRAGVLRCPYCHDDCRPEESVVCRDCLARHHAPCWQEHGSCSTCASSHRLVADPSDGQTAEGPLRLQVRARPQVSDVHAPRTARAVFAAQAMFLGGASALSSESAVWSSLAAILIAGMMLGAVHLRQRTRWSLAIQSLILLTGLILTPSLVINLNIGPSDSSLAIWGLGMLLALSSGAAAAVLPKDGAFDGLLVGREQTPESVSQDDGQEE